MSEQPKLFPNEIPKPDEHVQKHANNETSLRPINTLINNIATRLKILEERNETLRKKIQLTEQNSIDAEKEYFEEMEIISNNILSVKKTVSELSEKVGLLAEEINNFVKIEDFTTLEKYVSFWNPMDFVTRKEVNDFLRKKFGSVEKNHQNRTTIDDDNQKTPDEKTLVDDVKQEEKTRSEIESIMKKREEVHKNS